VRTIRIANGKRKGIEDSLIAGVGMKDLTKEKQRRIEQYVEEGIAKSDVVIAAFMKVPREEFVPEDVRNSAYEDRPLPIAFGQTISAPHCLGCPK
jgi:protein-L-isoaspartate(D-aspartate) O-methyltransferase